MVFMFYYLIIGLVVLLIEVFTQSKHHHDILQKAADDAYSKINSNVVATIAITLGYILGNLLTVVLWPLSIIGIIIEFNKGLR